MLERKQRISPVRTTNPPSSWAALRLALLLLVLPVLLLVAVATEGRAGAHARNPDNQERGGSPISERTSQEVRDAEEFLYWLADVPALERGRWLLLRPVDGEITSGFGMRVHPISGDRRMHQGVDIPMRSGESVVAAAPGRVLQAGWRGGYGNTVEILHHNNLSTLYAHLSSIEIRIGEQVQRGEQIGRVGSTGLSTGPHLHFETRFEGKPFSPPALLP